MPRRTRYQDPPDDGGEYDPDEYDAYRDYDPDDPDTYPEGVYIDPEPAEISCPNCLEEIAEQSEQCPYCGHYITKEETPGQANRRGWVIVVALLLIAATFLLMRR